MAQRKSIAVKVATVKVIKALEASLAKIVSNYTNQEANEAKFEKVKEKWQKEIGALAVKYFSKAESVSANTNYSGRINIDLYIPAGTFVIPAEPEKDFEVMSHWTYKEQKEELENAIRILKMTDEELVSASTFSSVAKYL